MARNIADYHTFNIGILLDMDGAAVDQISSATMTPFAIMFNMSCYLPNYGVALSKARNLLFYDDRIGYLSRPFHDIQSSMLSIKIITEAHTRGSVILVHCSNIP